MSPLRLLAQVPVAATATATGTNQTAKGLDYSGESYVVEKYATGITYAADGTGERLITVQVKMQSDAAVRQFGVLEFPYESRNENIVFVYVRVRKADGSVVPTSDADAQDQPAEVTRQAPFYSDIRNRQLPVKSLSVGDQLEYQVRQTRTVAAAPGHFWYVQNFLTKAVVLEETVSLSVPKQKYVQVVSVDNKPEIAEQGDRKIYRWKTSQLEKTKVPDEKAKKPVIVEQPPSIAVTTFKDWAEVGRWYGDLQKDRVGVTPTIQAKANDLAKGLTTDEEKIGAIYAYVSTQYRYIGVAFGIGRYQPHTADDVMQNQYGDCKDKHTLLASLLKAEGYDAWPVLVGSQHGLQPNVPSPGQFDHVMTAVTVNKAVWWMDSTPEVAPFRLLFSGMRDKLVLGIPNGATPVLMTTPTSPPFDMFDNYDAKGKLDKDGTLNAHFDISLRGDDEVIYRMGFHQTARVQWQTLMQNVSYASGFAGTVSNVSAGSPEKIAAPFQYSYDYTRKEYSDWVNRRILPLIPPVSFGYGEDDAKPVDTILLGGPVTYTFHSAIELPSTYTAELPTAVKLSTDFADYSATYTQSAGKLLAERRFVWKRREIPVARWDEYIKFEKAVLADEETFIQLIGAGLESSSSAMPSNPDALKLVQQAFAQIQAHNYDSARQSLDEAARLNPTERGLWAGYGYVNLLRNQTEDAVKAYQKEIENHPENFGVYYSLAGVQENQKHPEEAEKTLRALLKASPDDLNGHRLLASLLVRQRRSIDAVPVLEEAVKLAPEDAGLKVMLGSAELLGGSKEKGVVILHESIENSSDEGILNDSAYALADAGLDLAFARTACMKALQQLDEQTGKITLATVGDDDLKHVRQLAFTWDTMAWILFKQGEFENAVSYSEASWMLEQSTTVGTHLGRIYEKLDRKIDAVHTYRLAVAAVSGSPYRDVSEAQCRLAALKDVLDTHAKGPPDEQLGKLRSVEIPGKVKKSGSAEFLLLFSPTGVEDAQYVRGDESLGGSASLLKQTKFAVTFPSGSNARIIRRGIFYCSEVLKNCQFTMFLPSNTARD